MFELVIIPNYDQKFLMMDSPDLEWVPDVYYEAEFDSKNNLYYAVVYLHVIDQEITKKRWVKNIFATFAQQCQVFNRTLDFKTDPLKRF